MSDVVFVATTLVAGLVGGLIGWWMGGKRKAMSDILTASQIDRLRLSNGVLDAWLQLRDSHEALRVERDALREELNNLLAVIHRDGGHRQTVELERLDLPHLRETLCHVAQLLDGWHADAAWSEWDADVRRRVSEIQQRLEPRP